MMPNATRWGMIGLLDIQFKILIMKRLSQNEKVMVALYELMDLLPSGFEPNITPRLDEFYTFLTKQEKLTPLEAAEKYLGTATKVKYLNKLKRRLKAALSRYIVAYPSTTENKNIAFCEDCYRDFTIYKVLLIKGQRETGINIAENLLPRLEAIQLHNLTHVVANDLMIHYASIDVKPKLVKKYQEIAHLQSDLADIEAKVKYHFSNVVRYCNTKVSFTPKIVEAFIHATEETWPLLSPSLHHINRWIYTIRIFRFYSEYDYPNIISCCDLALANFPEDYKNIKAVRFLFNYYKAPALLAIGKLEEAKQVAKDANALMPKGNFNWHVMLLKRIVVCLHASDYQEAYDLYKAHQQKECLYENIAEYWNIIRGYLYFLIKREKIEPYANERFYLGKFLNEMPMYSKDKSGNNVNILIIQILVYMQRNQLGKIIDRIDSLKEYVRVYMRNPETMRAKAFIDMIIKMEQSYFVKTAAIHKTEKLREKLNQTPIKLRQNLSIEIIPFAVLWEEMLDMLDDNYRPSLRKRITIQ